MNRTARITEQIKVSTTNTVFMRRKEEVMHRDLWKPLTQRHKFEERPNSVGHTINFPASGNGIRNFNLFFS